MLGLWWARLLNFLSAVASAPSGGGGSFESIATATASTSTTISFTSIPSTYQHLQLRIFISSGSTQNALYLRFNNDSGSNYATHSIRGNGTAVSATADTYTSTTQMRIGVNAFSYPSVFIADIHDYASTTKNKTVRTFNGLDDNGSGQIKLLSGLWMSTNAVNRIDFAVEGTSPTFSGTFALYGIKGA